MEGIDAPICQDGRSGGFTELLARAEVSHDALIEFPGAVKLTKSSSSDLQDTGLEPAVNPPCWGSETAVSLNLTIPP